MIFKKSFKVYWRFSWKYSTPLVLFTLLISDLSNFGHIKYEGYVYPLPVQLLGYAITGASLIWIPTMALIQRRNGTTSSNVDSSAAWLLKPTAVSTYA